MNGFFFIIIRSVQITNIIRIISGNFFLSPSEDTLIFVKIEIDGIDDSLIECSLIDLNSNLTWLIVVFSEILDLI